MARKKSRKLLIGIIFIAVLVGGAGAYVALMSRPAADIEPSRLAAVEKGDLARSVVADRKSVV